MSIFFHRPSGFFRIISRIFQDFSEFSGKLVYPGIPYQFTFTTVVTLPQNQVNVLICRLKQMYKTSSIISAENRKTDFIREV
ncbi:hypothetical protein BXU10_02725 [Flavobacterium sp. LM4]|nr:hypothetical protein BXU10_02725 [Flavobacterium sp. LM4]